MSLLFYSNLLIPSLLLLQSYARPPPPQKKKSQSHLVKTDIKHGKDIEPRIHILYIIHIDLRIHILHIILTSESRYIMS